MAYIPRYLCLSTDYIRIPPAASGPIPPREALHALVAHLRSTGVWLDWTHQGHGQRTFRDRFETADVAVDAALRRGSVELRIGARDEVPHAGHEFPCTDLLLQVHVEDAGALTLRVALSVGGRELDRVDGLGDALLDAFTNFFLGLRRALPWALSVRPGGHSNASWCRVRRPRPPIGPCGWRGPGPGPLVLSDLSPRDPDSDAVHDYVRRIRGTPLPPRATRTVMDVLCVDRWVHALGDEEGVAEGLGDAEAWIGEVLEVEPASDFNAHGDRKVVRAGLEVGLPLLTFYDPTKARGIKAIYPDPDGLPLEIVQEVMAVVRVRRLPDGRELDRVDILFPRRADCVRWRPVAKRLGFARTLWADEHGQMWNINPLGDWRQAPSPVAIGRACVGLSREDAVEVDRLARAFYLTKLNGGSLETGPIPPALVARALEAAGA